MLITDSLYITDRARWRAWLSKNYDKKNEVWLVYYKKSSGKPRIPQADAVEEALCFGWIDSTVKKLDDERFIQRFTPRNKGSVWSDINRARVRKLIKAKLMTPSGMKTLTGDYYKKELRIPKVLDMPNDFENALKKDIVAYNNFSKFAPSYKKMYIWYVISAKKKETRENRIVKAVNFARTNSKYIG